MGKKERPLERLKREHILLQKENNDLKKKYLG
jgi:hypothetical protein